MPTPEERDLQRFVYAAIQRVDGVYRRFAGDVSRIVQLLGTGPLTHSQRRMAMRLIDRVIDRVFGGVQQAALRSELYNAILLSRDVAIDGPFARSVQRIRSIVERRNPAFWQRIVRQATPLSPDPFLRTVASFAVEGPVVNRARAYRAGLLDPERRWVDPKGYTLSQRVWRVGRENRRRIDDILREGIRNGEDAVSVARRLEQYLNPDTAPTKYLKDGRIVRRNSTATPGRGGYGSSFARTLARTEVTRAHGMATIQAAKITPGNAGIRWRLSASHVDQDECNDLASADSYDLGPGVYLVSAVPTYPRHPNDMCALLQEMKSRDDVIADIIATYGE